MDLSYMESVMWAFKQLWDKGLIYEAARVLPYSWAAETPLSNFETRLDDSYRERQDPAVTIRFQVESPTAEQPTEIWAWTTTPWTLPSNLALAVGPEIDYALVQLGERRVLIAEAARERFAKELDGGTTIATRKGAAFGGLPYRPLFPFFADTENAFRVLAADFVATDEGTGIVHMAPGFGEDDLEICRAVGIPVVCPIDDTGRFTHEVAPWAGHQVFDANPEIIKALKARGDVVRHETIVHNYPHCWRTDTPLIYRAMSSWFVKVTAIRERMVELNREINWVPSHIRDGLFGNWLEGARDWSISRNRFAARRSVWRSDDRRRQASAASTSSSAISRRPTTCRPDRRLVRPTPTTRWERDAPRPACSTSGSTRARCRTRRCTTRSRRRTGSSTTSRRTSSSSTSRRRAAGSTRCTCSRPRSSTGPRSRT
jgi:isoleucyl-tRNA synthetase